MNRAQTYLFLKMFEKGIALNREIYADFLQLDPSGNNKPTINVAVNLLSCFVNEKMINEHSVEARTLARKTVPVARRLLGTEYDGFLQLRSLEALALFLPDDAALDDVRLAVEILEETTRTSRQVMGSSHQLTKHRAELLAQARFRLSLFPPRA